MKDEKSHAWLQLFEIAREARENFWTIDGGTQNVTCSRGLEEGTQIKHNCGSTKKNKVKKKEERKKRKERRKQNLHLLLGAPLGPVRAGSSTQSPMELRHWTTA